MSETTTALREAIRQLALKYNWSIKERLDVASLCTRIQADAQKRATAAAHEKTSPVEDKR